MSIIGLLVSTEKTVKLGRIHISMASQFSLEVPHASEFSNSLDLGNETTQGMVVKPSKCPGQRILTPQGSRRTDLYRRIKRRLECTLK